MTATVSTLAPGLGPQRLRAGTGVSAATTMPTTPPSPTSRTGAPEKPCSTRCPLAGSVSYWSQPASQPAPVAPRNQLTPQASSSCLPPDGRRGTARGTPAPGSPSRRHPGAMRGGGPAVVGGPEGRLPCASAHLRLDPAGSRRVRRDLAAVARTLLARDHPRLPCSLRAGGRQRGARHHRRSAGGSRGPACRSERPRFSPTPPTGASRFYAAKAPSMNCKAEEMGGLGKCCKRS